MTALLSPIALFAPDAKSLKPFIQRGPAIALLIPQYLISTTEWTCLAISIRPCLPCTLNERIGAKLSQNFCWKVIRPLEEIQT